MKHKTPQWLRVSHLTQLLGDWSLGTQVCTKVKKEEEEEEELGC